MTFNLATNLPCIPSPRFAYIESAAYSPGKVILNYVTQKLKQSNLPPDFKQNCDELNTIRDQLLNQRELPEENRHLFADYVNLLTTLTKDIDLSKTGANMNFIWDGKINHSIDFEICCMGFNVVVGLLTQASKINFRNHKNLETVANCLNMAKAISNRIFELYRDDFQSVRPNNTSKSGKPRPLIISRENFLKLNKFIDACWTHATIYSCYIKKKPVNLFARLSFLLSTQYSELSQKFQEISQFFEILAYMKMYEFSIGNKVYGEAIAYGRNAVKYNQPSKNKKKGDIIPSHLESLLEGFQERLDKTIDENSRLYYDTPPKSIEVPAMKPLTFAGKYDWSGQISTENLRNSTKESLNDAVEKMMEKLQDEIVDAINDLSSAIALYPAKLVKTVENLHIDLDRKRDSTHELLELIKNLIHTNPSGVQRNVPNAKSLYDGYKLSSDMTLKTDQTFESQYEKAKKSVEPLLSLVNGLEHIKDSLDLEIDKCDELAVQANSISPNAKLSELIAHDAKFGAIINQYVSKIHSVINQSKEKIAEATAEAGKHADGFKAELVIVKEGFENSVTTYSDLINKMTQLQKKMV
ncbi:hypothetical protein TRFO_21014 [Tritrichomonas foetus]|uniref:BRO1 domain-containing protein n=1 Tax=Tritrichomonas foetus TaxID=1144522 RepID=A0A1J4KEQ6_9EUKA|nr:hypothetical protein TRFO_21014 [Tritrichomonas foetus]|eukprot:OHT09929.1 hypothetical protein TRFO_21014 [Tritrichomonas foetus]